ncbi:MAG: inverse autotransporter beta domain-containing protein [Verrucomicrobia bacterium]|nr:inverse autotransporter beta domain-containing protein [Verrucomicrobiota bacterium]
MHVLIFLLFHALYGSDPTHPYDLWRDSLKASADSTNIQNLILEKSTTEADLSEKELIDYHPPPSSASPLKRVYASYMAGGGVGYPCGYTSVGAFFAGMDFPTRAYPIVDLRGHYLDDNTWAANAGIGARFLVPNTCALMGLNVFYDYRNNSRGTYNQIGAGMEFLWKWLDIRVNGYLPVGNTTHVKNVVFDDYSSPYFIDATLTDYAFTSANGQIGAYFYRSNWFSLYAAGGPYYLSSKFKSDHFGISGRLEMQFTDFFSVAFITSYDPIFGTRCQGEAVLSFPLYRFSSQKRAKTASCGFDNRQLYERVRRNEIIPTSLDACFFYNF